MAEGFNYGAAEMNKLTQDAERYAVQLCSNGTKQTESGYTRWIGLTPEQYRQVAALIVSFDL